MSACDLFTGEQLPIRDCSVHDITQFSTHIGCPLLPLTRLESFIEKVFSLPKKIVEKYPLCRTCVGILYFPAELDDIYNDDAHVVLAATIQSSLNESLAAL